MSHCSVATTDLNEALLCVSKSSAARHHCQQGFQSLVVHLAVPEGIGAAFLAIPTDLAGSLVAGCHALTAAR